LAGLAGDRVRGVVGLGAVDPCPASPGSVSPDLASPGFAGPGRRP